MVDLQVEDHEEELHLVQEELRHRESHHKVEQVLDLMLVQEFTHWYKVEEEEVEQAEQVVLQLDLQQQVELVETDQQIQLQEVQ
jgi:hypothetical protein